MVDARNVTVWFVGRVKQRVLMIFGVELQAWQALFDEAGWCPIVPLSLVDANLDLDFCCWTQTTAYKVFGGELQAWQHCSFSFLVPDLTLLVSVPLG